LFRLWPPSVQEIVCGVSQNPSVVAESIELEFSSVSFVCSFPDQSNPLSGQSVAFEPPRCVGKKEKNLPPFDGLFFPKIQRCSCYRVANRCGAF
jgi:hypothetical protein